MVKVNYAFEKRQREIAKKKQKDQKQLKKQSGRENEKPESPSDSTGRR